MNNPYILQIYHKMFFKFDSDTPITIGKIGQILCYD